MNRSSLIIGLIVLAALVAVGVPLFVRTPVWVDVTYHDLSAWNVLHGGVHYRDVFETNLPGMVWLHALIRPLIGWSHEAIRLADLAVVALIVWLLTRILKRAGLSAAGRVWFVVAAALFYLFETEFIHCQRDGWMLLPALAAVYLRLPRWMKQSAAAWSLLEGLLWGGAVWIKPHILAPALLVWLVSWRWQTRRAVLVDTLLLLIGGLVAGGLGAWWLSATGTWGPMWDVLLNWNQEYYSFTWANLALKLQLVFTYFAPFSLLHAAAVPVGVWSLRSRDPARVLLSALYLGWLAQATMIQKPFDYAHYPPTLLGLAVLAAQRWPVGPVFLTWCLVGGAINEFAPASPWLLQAQQKYPIASARIVPHHALLRRERLRYWPRCWRDGSWELKDRLSYYGSIHCAPTWTELDQVALFLRTKDLRDGDLICWHDSTHPLYVWLEIKPGIRFPHLITAMKFKSKRERIRQETFSSRARYVVSDLAPVEYSTGFGPAPPPGPATRLPREFPPWGVDTYPWNQPVVFRAGRYFVHEIKDPRGEIFFPMPKELWED